MSEEGAAGKAAFGVVAIGRNEGERLRRCLASVAGHAALVVYVDSGSSDGSVEIARSMGHEVVELDLKLPFTAARARNAGLDRMLEVAPELPYVQFVDGDCEFANGWFEQALAFLESRPEAAVVCGRRRERHPERSVYNLICDIEWDTPIGKTNACGGDALMRIAPLLSVDKYRADLIAGEEPELCIRLRAAGWSIWRLDVEMTLHDAAMTRFSQWWRRGVRFGHAMAEGSALHGAPPERHWVRESRSAWIWGLVIPVVVLMLSSSLSTSSLCLLTLYPLQVARLAVRGKRTSRENWWQALFLVVGKFPEMLGQCKYLMHRGLGLPSRLIEYK